MFEASFIMHAFGEGESISGVYYPLSFMSIPAACALPLETSSTSSSSGYGPVLETHGFCHAFTMSGKPATGSGALSVVPTGTGPSGVALPQSAFGITTTQVWPSSYLTTYATFRNAAGSFFAGGGPAAAGTVRKKGQGNFAGSWTIQPGEHAFGGPMGLLGRLGAYQLYTVTGKAGTYAGSMSWNMIKGLGRERLGSSPMGPGPDPMNPYTNTGMFVNTLAGATHTYTLYGTGTPWTTGAVTVYALAGSFTTVMRRSGFDTTSTTSMGDTVRNIQLVTPALTHWRGSGGANDHTGHIGVLRLQIVPEPGGVLLLAVGVGVLIALRSAVTRRGEDRGRHRRG